MATGSSYGVTLIPMNSAQGFGLQDQPQVIPNSSNTSVQAKPPKSQLHEFYQQHKGTPVFRVTQGSTTPAAPTFSCILECPEVETVTGAKVPKQEFRGEGRSKKAAEHAAAKEALDLFRDKGLLPAEFPLTGYPQQPQVPQYQVLPMNQVPIAQNYGAVEMHQSPAGSSMLNYPAQQNLHYGPLGLGVETLSADWAAGTEGRDQEAEEGLTKVLNGANNMSEEQLRESFKRVMEENWALRKRISKMSEALQAALDSIRTALEHTNL